MMDLEALKRYNKALGEYNGALKLFADKNERGIVDHDLAERIHNMAERIKNMSSESRRQSAQVQENTVLSQEAFMLADKNHDGKLGLLNGERRAYNKMDLDRDGRFSRDELEAAKQNTVKPPKAVVVEEYDDVSKQQKKLDKQLYSEARKVADKNENGLLGFAETRALRAMDTNKDGKYSAEEIDAGRKTAASAKEAADEARAQKEAAKAEEKAQKESTKAERNEQKQLRAEARAIADLNGNGLLGLRGKERDIYNNADANRDGKLTREEVNLERKAANELQTKEALAEDRRPHGKLHQKLDVNDDGKVNLKDAGHAIKNGAHNLEHGVKHAVEKIGGSLNKAMHGAKLHDAPESISSHTIQNHAPLMPPHKSGKI
jgi:hypothetical protein